MAALLGGVLAGVGQPKAADAATASNFDPGHIIDDSLFYDGSLMPEAAIQAFLNAKVPTCTATAGDPGCLKGYASDSTSRPANKYCAAYAGGTAELASRIIFKVAQACNISPQALLVIMQKEEGLVTATNPSAGRYTIAMGYGCPDTTVCDTQYYGFANQVYSAAQQFNSYVQNRTYFRYKSGVVNTIQWSPDLNCGSSQVFIQNDATAGLYNYTPYRPNQAALDNLYGPGDGCSSYGNRNFWVYFTDWFGSTTVAPAPAAFVKALYADVLGRAASSGEIGGWGRQLMNGVPPVQVASGFVNSDEYRLIRINNAYQTILGRPAEPGGALGWLNGMKNGALGTDDVDKVFLASKEYLDKSGGTNETFVAALYQRLLKRPAGPPEIAGWAAIAAVSGRQAVVNAIWQSVETARERVTIMYHDYLGRAPEPGGVGGWAGLSIAQGDAEVRWAIIGSAEYWSRASARFPVGS
ncbi:MAG: DUF4214 domain-containing protein [Lacisediminihabitans sp.]